MFGRSVSLVKQVKEQLYKQIVQNEFDGTEGQLPSEPQLSTALGVSRATVREALTMLEREGIVIRRHGVGTFVNRNLPGVPLSFSEVVEFEDLIKREGYQADVRVLHMAVKPAGSTVPLLQLDSTDEVFTVEKIFLADGNPVIWCQNTLPTRLIWRSGRRATTWWTSPCSTMAPRSSGPSSRRTGGSPQWSTWGRI